MNDKKIIEVLEMISKNQEDDAKNFDGAPFTGHMVAIYFANQGAAIATLADIVKFLVESRPAPGTESEMAEESRERIITQDKFHVCINGARLGVGDLLGYARACLMGQVNQDVNIARLYADLEEVIYSYKSMFGTPDPE
jgi:hypothetical protein